MDTLHFYFIYSQQSMSLENSQDIKIISIYSVDDSIFSKNQLSYIRVGNFGNNSFSERFDRQGFCLFDDLVKKFPSLFGTVLRYKILNLEQSFQSFMSPFDFHHMRLLSLSSALSSFVL
jgi:hypothetical protein